MSQIPIENDDNCSDAASDFAKLNQPDEVPDQQEEQPQFGFQQNPLDCTKDTGSTSTHNYENGLKEQKLMIKTLEAKIETLQFNVQKLELKAEIRALRENAEQNAKYQALETKMNEVVRMLSTQNEEHRTEMAQLKDGFAKEMSQLEAKNRKLEEKLMSNVELQTTKNGALDTKMEQLQTEFSQKLDEQQKQMMAQFQAQLHSLEQKQKEAEQRAQMGKNQLAENIQQKMEKFREEINKNDQPAIGSNFSKLDYIWSQLMANSQIFANPKGIVWNRSKTKASTSISECGLKASNMSFKWLSAIATKGYVISWEHYRKNNFLFSGSILSYYEVTITYGSFEYSSAGFTDGSKHSAVRVIGGSPNSYGIERFGAKIDTLWLSGKKHKLDRPFGPIARRDVFGSGLLLNSKNELAVFFTLNGILLGKQIPINPTVDRLYPTIYIFCASVEANFGDNLIDKPFKFDIFKCPVLVFE